MCSISPPVANKSLTVHVTRRRGIAQTEVAVMQCEPPWVTEAPHCGQRQTTGPSQQRCSRIPAALTPAGEAAAPGLLLFTFLSMRTVKTSRSLSGSLLSTSPWLNSWTGWLRRAVRFELDRPISFPLRGCSSAAIFSGRPVFTTLGLCDSNVLTDGRFLHD